MARQRKFPGSAFAAAGYRLALRGTLLGGLITIPAGAFVHTPNALALEFSSGPVVNGTNVSGAAISGTTPSSTPDSNTATQPATTPPIAQPSPTGVATAPAAEPGSTPGVEAAPEEPAQPEDAAIQDDIDEPAAVEEPAATEPQVDASGVPLAPRHGVPVPKGGDLFPTQPIIERQKAFWIHAFTAMNSRQGLLHDGRIIGPTYETIEFDEDLRPKEQNAIVRRHIQNLAARLNMLADRIETNQPLDEDLEQLRATLPKNETPELIRERIRYVRFQRGLSDRFRNGLVRSGAILEEVRRIMSEHGVPPDLAYLPHVESSFNNATLSKAGAAGIWQFTRGTGKIFLTVQGEVDERLDPLLAARAAAIFLRQNYDRLGTWPLAITAYNHGPQSLEKIVAKTGTVDMGTLIETYNGPLFKFASKNFYSEFLAARQVATHYKDYFGDVEMAKPMSYARIELPFYLEFQQAAHAVGMAVSDLASLNPSLRSSVLMGAKYIPKGFRLRVPAKVAGPNFLAAIPEASRAKEQKISTEVRVARGDTLFSIGRRNNIPWTAIAAANNLGPRGRLFVGQRLILPRPGQPVPLQAVVVAAQTSPAPANIQSAPVAAASTSQPVALQAVASSTTTPAAAVLPIEASGIPEMISFESPAAPTAVSDSATTNGTAPVSATPPAAGGASTHASNTPAPAPASAPGALPAAAASGSNEPSTVSAAALALQDVDAGRKEGTVRSVFGETLGHYADWAQVPAVEIRERNRIRESGMLRPGREVVIPLHGASAEAFNAHRLAYHRAREQTFFSAYTVRDKFEVRLTRGQSIWTVAQEHNVPMWLLYRENPVLLDRQAQAGMIVIVPRVEEAQSNPR